MGKTWLSIACAIVGVLILIGAIAALVAAIMEQSDARIAANPIERNGHVLAAQFFLSTCAGCIVTGFGMLTLGRVNDWLDRQQP